MNRSPRVIPPSSAARPKGSVTNALEDVASGQEMSSRLYEFVRERLEKLVRKRLAHAPGLPAEVDDVVQVVATAAHRVARSRNFKTRADFANLCVALVDREVVNQLRHEFAKKRKGRYRHASPEELENVRGKAGVSEEEQLLKEKFSEEVVALTNDCLTEEPDKLKREVLCRWIATSEGAIKLRTFVEQLNPPSSAVPSDRKISRWLAEFRGKIYNAWIEKHGHAWTDAQVEEFVGTKKRTNTKPR